MYEFNVDKASSQYKGPFNQIAQRRRASSRRKDTAIVTPNSDTPYSMVQMDLRAEPIVLCVPAVEKSRYYSVQLIDMYTFNYGYIGSRATGNDAGCYMVAGPGWKGETPAGIDKVFPCETDFALAIYRTQLFNPADIDEREEGAGRLRRAAALRVPEAARAAGAAGRSRFRPSTEDAAFKTDFVDYLNFLLQFAPDGRRSRGRCASASRDRHRAGQAVRLRRPVAGAQGGRGARASRTASTRSRRRPRDSART